MHVFQVISLSGQTSLLVCCHKTTNTKQKPMKSWQGVSEKLYSLKNQSSSVDFPKNYSSNELCLFSKTTYQK